MFRVERTADSVGLFDGAEELVYWDRQEWEENPSLLATIEEAIRIGHAEGSDGIRVRLITG